MNTVFDNALFDAFANASENIYVYVTDMEKNITRWSRRAVDFFNLDSEYLTDVRNMWIQYIHPEDRQIYLADINAVFSGEHRVHNCQYRVRNRYGEFVWVECHGSVIRDENGLPKVFAGIMTRLDNPNKYDSMTHFLSASEFFRCSFEGDGTVMLLGIDRLRSINSQHGLLFGNKVIKYLAEVLRRHAPGCTLFRYWGSDFIVLGPGLSVEKMLAFFQNINGCCTRAQLHSDVVSFTVSAGIIPFTADSTQADLLARAEMALNYAKNYTSSHVAVLSPEIEQLQSRRIRISEELISSIQNGFRGFRLVFQPIMSADTKHVISCEALLRWESGGTQIGSCRPDEFIPILEENRGIIEVGSFVIRETTRHLARWQQKYPNLNAALNVSYLQLEKPGLVRMIVSEAEKHHITPGTLVVELTESVLIDDTRVVNDAFDYLQSHGIKTALDDFGRGNSSFWMLHNLHVDYVKLDQAFIRSLDRQEKNIDFAIVQSTLHICDSIGNKAIAEGVENSEVYNIIKNAGFTGLQGYLFSKPVEIEAFEDYLDRYPPVN